MCVARDSGVWGGRGGGYIRGHGGRACGWTSCRKELR